MKISAPGIYDIPIDAYHGDCCAGPSISASGLKEILECPAKYWAFSPLNPHRYEDESTKALDIGKAAHALVLGEPNFNAHFIVSPHDEFRTKEAREWRDAQSRTVLKEKDFEAVTAMARAQRESAAVMMAFENGKPEQSLIWKDAETGVWLKSRPDWLPDDPSGRFICDYKTALTIEPRKLSADAFKFGYHIQAALQWDAVAELCGCARPLGIAHVVQEKDRPYLADLRMFTPEQLDYGRLLYRKALRIFAECLSSGKWPAYTNEPQYFWTPAWVAKEMENEDGSDGYTGTPASRYSAADYFGTL